MPAIIGKVLHDIGFWGNKQPDVCHQPVDAREYAGNLMGHTIQVD